MKRLGYLLIGLLVGLIGLVGLFVWEWYSRQRPIPGEAFAAVVWLIATLLSYLWFKDKGRHRR